MKQLHNGIIVKFKNKWYRANLTKKQYQLVSKEPEFEGGYVLFIDQSQAESVLDLEYKVIYRGIEAQICSVGEDGLEIVFDRNQDTKGINYEKIDRYYGRKIVQFHECEEVYLTTLDYEKLNFKEKTKTVFKEEEFSNHLFLK